MVIKKEKKFKANGDKYNQLRNMFAIRKSINLQKIVKIAQSNQSIVGAKTFYTYSPEPGQPLNREPKFCSIDEAVKCVKSGKENYSLFTSKNKCP